jgi:hypothetical protein
MKRSGLSIFGIGSLVCSAAFWGALFLALPRFRRRCSRKSVNVDARLSRVKLKSPRSGGESHSQGSRSAARRDENPWYKQRSGTRPGRGAGIRPEGFSARPSRARQRCDPLPGGRPSALPPAIHPSKPESGLLGTPAMTLCTAPRCSTSRAAQQILQRRTRCNTPGIVSN